MKSDISNNELYELEMVLSDFKLEYETLQTERAAKWRLHFIISFSISFLLVFNQPYYWWVSLAVAGYFAGTLFTMLRQRAKTSTQIIEHQQQLELVRLLRKFQASPYSEKEE